jgi:hypothetical protein
LWSVPSARQLTSDMEHAYQRGDHHLARAHAKSILSARDSQVAEEQAAAKAMLERTAPDAFLMVVGTLGLGLMVWLVYNYIL